MSAVANAHDTFPKLLLRNAEAFAARPAMREKYLGIWQVWSWSQVRDEVCAFALGLARQGLKRGDKVAIIGDNRPRLYWALCAVQTLGGIPVPVYQDAVAEEMSFVLSHAGVCMAVVEDQEQVDKLLEIREDTPALTTIIYDDERGLENYVVSGVIAYDRLRAQGLKSDGEGGRQQWLAEIAKGNAADTAVILYTSGTTGQPKGVVLTMGNVIWAARTANHFDRLDSHEDVIAYLPMAWVGDHVFSYAQSLDAGYCVNCPESRETIVEDRREIGTSYAFAPPRVYENLITMTMVRMEDAGWLKKKMFHGFLAVARRCGENILDKKPVRFPDRLLYFLGDLCVYGPLKNRYGLSGGRVVYTAGEAIGPEIFRYYRSLGINLKQLYGQTEASVYITSQSDGDVKPDTVGKTMADIEIKIDQDGQVLYRSPGVFREYYRNPEATAATLTPDGWVRSGDAGLIDDAGHLKIIDRVKDVGRLNDGTLFPPKYIENKLKFFPNIKEAVAFGHGRDYTACFINIDLMAVGSWAERNNVTYASYQELAAHAGVYAMIEANIRAVNAELAREPQVAGAQIRRFLVLHKELDADDGEITRTSKVRRAFIAERYAPLIAALYEPEKTHQHIATRVTFEDGRKGIIEGNIEIRDMDFSDAAASSPADGLS